MIRRPPRSPLFPYPTLFRSYDQKAFPAEARRNALLPVVAGSDTNGALRIHQDVTLYASELDAGKSVTHTLAPGRDRKSTRLNSSHGYISYAVFCLKKKKNTH